MTSRKYGNFLNLEDHTGMHGESRPVIIHAGKRSTPVLDSQDILSYGDLPYIETRTAESFKGTFKPDDRTVNDDRDYENHMEPFTRQTSIMERHEITTDTQKEIAHPLSKQGLKLRSRNAKNAHMSSVVATSDMEIMNRGPEMRPFEPLKNRLEPRNGGAREEAQIEIRASLPIKSKISAEENSIKPNSGFDISFLTNSKMKHIEKLRKQVEPHYFSQREEATITAGRTPSSFHKEQKQEELRYPRSTQDFHTIDTSKSSAKSTLKAKKQAESRHQTSTRDVQTIDEGKPRSSQTKARKQDALRNPKSSKEIPTIEPSVRKIQSRSKRSKNGKAVQVSDRDQELIHQTGKHSTTRSDKKKLTEKKLIKTAEFDELNAMGASLAPQLASIRPKSKEIDGFGDIAEREQKVEIPSRRASSKSSKQGTSSIPKIAEETIEVHSKSKSTKNSQKKAPRISDKPVQSIEEKPEIHSKNREKKTGKRQNGALKVQSSNAERPEISYVKYDPSSKIMESKQNQIQEQSRVVEKEKTIEAIQKPSKSQRSATAPISASAEGEDNQKLEEKDFIMKGSRNRLEKAPIAVDSGVDSDKRIENPKIILNFD
jgi:hypothetical protein